MPELAVDLLRRLAADASAAELRELGARHPAGSVTRQAVESALAVRELIDGLRQRAGTLSALVDIARDLTALSDPDGVLRTIVRRARALLDTDVAYLTLADPDRGDTVMQVTDGSVSAVFQSVRLPLGAGLGGLVAKARRPSWSSDYLHDPQFEHTSEIDEAVTDEGLVAICGTPLLVGEEFVGVLFAANRTPRPFSRDEVAVLGSLAALAAICIVQSRAAAQTRTALAELSAVHETVRRYAAGIERAAAAHDRFAQLVLGGGGTDEIAAALSDLLGGWVVLIDPQGRPVSSALNDTGTVLEELLAQVRVSPALVEAHETGRLATDGWCWVAPIRAAGSDAGDLVVGGIEELDQADRRTIERAGVVAALTLVMAQAEAEAEQRSRADLVGELVSGAGTAQRRSERALRRGLDLSREHCVVIVGADEAAHRRGLDLAVRAAAGPQSLTGTFGGDVVVVTEGVDPRARATQIHQRLAGLGEIECVAAGPARDPDELVLAHAEAARTRRAAHALGLTSGVRVAGDLGFAGLIVSEAPDVDEYVGRVLGAVSEYDEQRKTDLLATLTAYFDAGRNHRAAAEALHVHPNTLGQRLDRITALLGDRWQEPGPALEVQLALHLRRLSRTP